MVAHPDSASTAKLAMFAESGGATICEAQIHHAPVHDRDFLEGDESINEARRKFTRKCGAGAGETVTGLPTFLSLSLPAASPGEMHAGA